MEEFDEMDTVNPVISETCETQSDSQVSSYNYVATKIEVLAESVAFNSQMDMLPIIHDSVKSQVGHQQESISNPQSDNAPAESFNAANNNTVFPRQKTFSCETCSKRFYSISDLNRHKRIHTGEKPYACDQCEKKCSLKGNLKKHMRTHTGEKPFNCVICGNSFTQKSTLTYHLKTHANYKN